MNPLPPLSQQALNDRYTRLSQTEQLLPIKSSAFYQKKIQEELTALGDTSGPLHRVIYPSAEKILQRAPGEVSDFVEDRGNMPPGLEGVVIRKYRERLLFLPTSFCAANCQYCFRQDVLVEEREKSSDPLHEQLEGLKHYLKDNPEVSEIILSGGDPMTLPPAKLTRIIESITAIPTVESLRIHSRTLAFAPQVYSEEKAAMLGAAKVRLVSHIVHPYEICDEVKAKIHMLRKHGVRLYNQFPLLRNVNDHSDVLLQLLKTLDELEVRNLSMFIADPVKYSAAFRIRLQRLFSIIDELNWKTPSWINSTRVVLDSDIGKVRREDLRYFSEEQDTAVFGREGQQVIYPNFPAELDVPGDAARMLWKQ